MVEPVDPLQRRVLHVIHGSPRTSRMDELRLEQTIDGLSQGVVVAVPDAANGWLDASLGQALRISNGQILG